MIVIGKLWQQASLTLDWDTTLLQILLKGSAKQGFKRIRVHVLTDGRDVADGSSLKFVQMLEDTLSELRQDGCDAQIASGGGRMRVIMDRYEVF